MRILITAGPTREPIDPVRFITNASSGRMGVVLAELAVEAGCEVTLLMGAVTSKLRPAVAKKVQVVPFATVDELQDQLARLFPQHDALIMAAAVGDFRVETVSDRKLHREDGPIQLTLIPTQDVLASVTANKRDGQIVVSFAVEDGLPDEAQARARSELAAKGADLVVVNTPAAMASANSLACILSADDVLLRWAVRPKKNLAAAIIHLLQEFRSK